MRVDGFLRTPIRSDHQARMLNLVIAETALNGNPDPALPYPQSLELNFDVAATTTDVQVVMPWEGIMQFLPDATTNHPTVPTEVTIARFPTWAVVGDLVLQTLNLSGGGASLTEAFAAHLPLIDPAPGIVRFSKVRLTQDFLFTTLKDLPKRLFMFEGAAVAVNDPLRLQKLIIRFLSGNAHVTCRVDPANATKDHTLLAMPSVSLAAAGTTTFRITMASVSENSLSGTWFTMRPEDAVSGEVLVPMPIDNRRAQLSNPAHPNYSVIPARMIFQRAAAAAYAPDHGAATPLRVALTAALPAGQSYRKVEVIRPPLPGREVSSAATRPYPMYRLCWMPVGGGATNSLRLPLSGRVYVPLADGAYRFWVIPRSADPAAVLAGDHVRLSLQGTAPARYINPPSTTLDVALGAAPSARLFSHLHPYESRLVWEGYAGSTLGFRRRLKVAAARAWGLVEMEDDDHGVFDWFVLPLSAARQPYRELYGYFRESAGRHGLAPEFLQVVFFGEGGAGAFTPAFDPARSLDTFEFAGLDLSLYRTGRLPVGAPLVPPEAVAAGDALEIAEYSFNLVTEGYLDAGTAAAVTWAGRTEVNEIGRTIHVGTIAGWKPAVEIVAAELHARLDEMTAYLAGRVVPIAVVEENQRRFLAYLRYSARPGTARGHADHLSTRLRRWTTAFPPLGVPSMELPHFLAIQRVAVTQWHEAAAFYRFIR